MSKEKILVAFLILFAMIGAATAQDVQVEGLEFEEVQPNYGDKEINFQTDTYLDKNLTYQEFLVPENLSSELVTPDQPNGQPYETSGKVAIFQPPSRQGESLKAGYAFRGSTSVSQLQGYSFGIPEKGNSGQLQWNGNNAGIEFDLNNPNATEQVIQTELQEGELEWDIDVSSHYEHLIIDYQLYYNETGSEPELVEEWQDVYSGEEPELLPFEGQINRYDGLNTPEDSYVDRFLARWDRGYDLEPKNATVVMAFPEDHNMTSKDLGYNTVEVSGSKYYDKVVSEAESVNRTGTLLNDTEGYKLKAFNTTVDGNKTVNLNYKINSSLNESNDMRMWILGSFAGGSGSSSDPYQIETCQQLQDIQNDSDASYELIQDIDCSDTSNWNGGSGFEPIGGGEYDRFKGVLDGGGYSITGLYIDRPSTTPVGLIRDTYAAVIKDLEIVDADVTGDGDTGILMGDGTPKTISNVFTSGQVSGAYGIGGIAGTFNVGDLVDSHSTASVSGSSYQIGGVAGYNGGVINRTFATGTVSGTSTEIGGLLGYNAGSIDDSYWDTESTGMSTGIGNRNGDFADVEGLTTSEMQGSSAETNMPEFDWSGLWLTQSNDYPYLCWETNNCNAKPVLSPGIDINESESDAFLDIGIDDSGEQDIESYSGLSSVQEFSNSTLSSYVSLPFSSTVEVADIEGATGNSNINISRSVSSVHERSEFSHDASVQRVEKTGTLNNNGDTLSYNWTFQDIEGSIVQGLTFSGYASASSSVEEDVVAESDWIVDESTSSGVSLDSGFNQSFDEQHLLNGTTFSAVNERGFTFHDVNISSYCPDASLKNVSSGGNSISCGADQVSGDFIVNEEARNNTYGSGDVRYGQGIDRNFTVHQPLYLENTENFSATLNASNFATKQDYCSVENEMVEVRGLQNGVSEIVKSCKPAEEVSYSISQTTTQDFIVHDYSATVDVLAESASETSQTYFIPVERLPEYGRRDPGESELAVDGKSEGLSISDIVIEDGTEYVKFQIPDDFGDSSIHEGEHDFKFTYKERRSTETTSGAGGGGGSFGGGTSDETVAEENNTEFSWMVRAQGSEDSEYFQILGYPGRSFTKTVVVENTGDTYPTIDVDCEGEYCEYVNLGTDRINFSEGFNEATVEVSGNVPADATFNSESFDVVFKDGSYDGGSSGIESVQFEISISGVAGRLIDSVTDLAEVRTSTVPEELPAFGGLSIPYIVGLIPLGVFFLTLILSETLTSGYVKTRVGSSLALAVLVIFIV